jgi:hypothetical protein
MFYPSISTHQSSFQLCTQVEACLTFRAIFFLFLEAEGLMAKKKKLGIQAASFQRRKISVTLPFLGKCWVDQKIRQFTAVPFQSCLAFNRSQERQLLKAQKTILIDDTGASVLFSPKNIKIAFLVPFSFFSSPTLPSIGILISFIQRRKNSSFYCFQRQTTMKLKFIFL